MSGERVTIDDLAFAVDWLDTHDGVDDDGTPSANDLAARRVAAWLRAEIQRRVEAATVRDLARKTGAPPAAARAALRAAMRERSTP